jgi:hypothetical protein
MSNGRSTTSRDLRHRINPMPHTDKSLLIYFTLMTTVRDLSSRLLVEQTNCCEILGGSSKLVDVLRAVKKASVELGAPRIDQVLINSFIQNNHKRLLNSTTLRVLGLKTLPVEYYANMTFSKWDKFYADYPACNGFATMSNVGYDLEETSAIVYCETASGPTGIYGYFYHLHRTESAWKVVKFYGVISG